MNKLVHPATLFVQNVVVTEKAYWEMEFDEQRAIFDYMDANGEGYWADKAKNVAEAVLKFGDARFEVGSFANDDTMKRAFAEATDGYDGDDPLQWYKDNVGGDCEISEPKPPIVLNCAAFAAEHGLIEWGWEWFYQYWSNLPTTRFVRCTEAWNCNDPSGRGGY